MRCVQQHSGQKVRKRIVGFCKRGGKEMTAIAIGIGHLKNRERSVRHRLEDLFSAERDIAHDLARALMGNALDEVTTLRARRRQIVDEIEALSAALPYLGDEARERRPMG